MRRIRYRLTRIHLWIGEKLGLTHYRNCHSCKHCHRYEELGPELIGCDVYRSDPDIPDDFLAITDPSEAVWCDEYEDKRQSK